MTIIFILQNKNIFVSFDLKRLISKLLNHHNKIVLDAARAFITEVAISSHADR
jgi:hypothetical protein